MKRKFYLIVALAVALILSGTYAYTYTSAGVTGGAVTAQDIATCERAPTGDQPDWYSILGYEDTEILRPNANGDLIQFEDLVGAPTHWEAVDEEFADDATSHVGSDGGGRTDLFQLTDSGLTTGITIYSVTVYERVRREGWFDDDWQIVIKSGDTFAYSPTFAETTTWVERSYQWTTDPNTGGAWTVAAVDALQAGAYVVTGVDVTQVYVEVNYNTTLLCGDVPTGDLFDVTVGEYYTGDLQVMVYLTNTGALIKAYRYLNMKLELRDKLGNNIYEGETPDHRLLTLENGVATFDLQYGAGAGSPYLIYLAGGSYCLVSTDLTEWDPDHEIEPELYCEVAQK